MCGRYVIDDDADIVEMNKILSELKQNYGDTNEYQGVKRGEIFPGNFAPVIIPAKNNKVDAVPIQWGIDNLKYGGSIINARSEGIAVRSMFRNAIHRSRCIIPTNGFYEWKNNESGAEKEKYLIKDEDSPMLYLGGIFDFYRNKRGERQARFVVMTREARGVMATIHHRMPVIIPKSSIMRWLNGNMNQIDELVNAETPSLKFSNLGETQSKIKRHKGI